LLTANTARVRAGRSVQLFQCTPSTTNHRPTAGSEPSLRYPCGVVESNEIASPALMRCSSKPRVSTSSQLIRKPYSMPEWRISVPDDDEVPPGGEGGTRKATPMSG